MPAASSRVYLHYMVRRGWLFKRVLLATLLGAAAYAVAQEGGDLEAQILYAFHTEDTNQLLSLIQTFGTQEQAGAAPAALRYHFAHAEYRLGRLMGNGRTREAEAAFTACIDQLKPVLLQDVNSAEALALQSVCYSNRANFGKLQAALDRAHAADRINAAAKLAPRNPRVVYLEAIETLRSAAMGSNDYQRAYAQLQLSAQLFEAASATSIEVPGWGHAEAYLEMGRQLMARGDVVGARNWIEKSLIMAPHFKAAQRELAALVRR